MGWKELSYNQRLSYYNRLMRGERATDLAKELGIGISSFSLDMKAFREANPELCDEDVIPPQPELAALSADDQGDPVFKEIYVLLQKNPYSLDALSEKFDRSKATIKKWIAQMKAEGFTIQEEQSGTVSFPKVVRPEPVKGFIQSLADQQNSQIIKFAAFSDLHAGSLCSQPSALNSFLSTAVNDYGIEHIFFAGDMTQGVGGYSGIELDMLPELRGYKAQGIVTEHQVWLADQYIPQFNGVKYYILGGNHDYWHMTRSGIDAVKRLTNRRDDMSYLGYDVADIPLTDRVDIRLWHPSGGVPYALSYRIQKALEHMAFEELTTALASSENPRLRILIAGHTHVEVKFNRGPMLAVNIGCFEGQTNYLKRKGLFPQVGGALFKVWLTDSGIIARVEYTFFPFVEVVDDWKNWPTPEQSLEEKPDEVPVLFHA